MTTEETSNTPAHDADTGADAGLSQSETVDVDPPNEAAEAQTIPESTTPNPNPNQNPSPEAQSDSQPQIQPQAPPPPPPNPGPRASRLHQLYAQSLRRTLSKLQWDNFAACYPTIAMKAEPVLRQVQVQMVDKLAEKCEKEFENILTARQVVAKLNELEVLIGDAARRRASSSSPPTPPHLLPASTILTAHMVPSLASHQSHLNARLQTTQSRNHLLYEDIARQRREVDEVVELLERAVGDVRGANGVLGSWVGGIAGEAREVDGEIGE